MLTVVDVAIKKAEFFIDECSDDKGLISAEVAKRALRFAFRAPGGKNERR